MFKHFFFILFLISVINVFSQNSNITEGDQFPIYKLTNSNNNSSTLFPFREMTLLMFWDSNCKICLENIEFVKHFKKEFKQYNILLINLDKKAEIWKESLKKYSLENYENYFLENSFNNKMAIDFDIKSLPINIIINNKNIVENKNATLFETDSISYNFFYKSNIYELTEAQKEKIQKIFKANTSKKINNIIITGYTDVIGNDASNFKLSKNRATQIEAYINQLSNQYISKIETKAKGEVKTDKEVAEKKNRRVEITLYYLKAKKSFSKTFKEIKIGEKLVLENILFEGNRAVMLPISFPEIRKLKEYLIKNKDYCIEVQGHINGGNIEWKNEFPKILSNKRAEFVYYYLIKNKIRASRLSYKGYGAEHTIATGAESYKNRRVEILRINCTSVDIVNSNRIDSNLFTTLYFNENSLKMFTTFGDKIHKLIDFLNDNSNSKIILQGHSCCARHEEENDINLKRAKFINDYLVKKGIDQNRITFKAIPIIPIKFDNKIHSIDRKVEIYFLNK